MKHSCLVFVRDHDAFKQNVDNYIYDDLEIIYGRNEEIINEYLPKVNILFGNPPIIKNYINNARSVQWVQSSFAGVDALVADNLRADYILTGVKDVYGPPIAEYVFAYILGLKRQVFNNKKWQAENYWNQFSYDVIEGKNIGIVGTGSIGQHIASVAKTFGMNTKGLRTSNESLEFFDAMYTKNSKADFLKDLDYVVCVLPNTKKTKHFFNAETFNLMEKKSIFINVGRGANVCEEDLIAALDKQKITGAILDVFETEPLPKESKFWNMENVILTPHVSGYVTGENLFGIFANNYERFRKGEDLQYAVDFTKGY